MGWVLSVLNDRNEVKISFLQLHGCLAFFTFPFRTDILLVPINNILADLCFKCYWKKYQLKKKKQQFIATFSAAKKTSKAGDILYYFVGCHYAGWCCADTFYFVILYLISKYNNLNITNNLTLWTRICVQISWSSEEVKLKAKYFVCWFHMGWP